MLQKLLTSLGWNLLRKLGGELYKWVMKKIYGTVQTKEQKAAKEAYEKIKNDPAKTQEEKANAYADYINSGRH